MFQNRQNQIFGFKSGSQYFPEKCVTDLPQCVAQTLSYACKQEFQRIHLPSYMRKSLDISRSLRFCNTLSIGNIDKGTTFCQCFFCGERLKRNEIIHSVGWSKIWSSLSFRLVNYALKISTLRVEKIRSRVDNLGFLNLILAISLQKKQFLKVAPKKVLGGQKFCPVYHFDE